MAQEKGWTEIPIGGMIVEPGNSVEYKTGTWRTMKPVKDEERCTHCMICWVYCPDSCILVENGRQVGFDLEHCKGCGICAAECPVKVTEHAVTGQSGKVIQMVEDSA
jgi:pyruvate ferredoxin oxidoreductase delta subunit